MKKNKVTTILVAVLSILLMISICACANNTDDDEVTTTYTYSFTIDSTDYTYELIIGSTGSLALELKQGSSLVYQFNELTFSKKSQNVYELTDVDETASLKVSVKSDNTFEIDSISGEIHNLILGYEIYAGEYTLISDNSSVEVILNDDGTCLIDDNEATFFPWNGGSIILKDDDNGAICSIDLEEKELVLKGAAASDAIYVFDATIYDFDFAAPLQANNQLTKLYLSEDSNKAYFQKTAEDPYSYHLYFGSYETTDDAVTFSYGDSNIDFLVDGLLFDYYFEEIAVEEKWIKLYEGENKTVYYDTNTILTGTSVASDEDSYIFYDFTQDIYPIKCTYVIDAKNLNHIATYWGYFQGLSTTVYTASDNSEIVIFDENTLYTCNGGYEQTKFYSVETYSAADYDPNVLNLETGYIANYYIFEDTFYYYSPLTSEEKQGIIPYPSQFIYGKEITVGDNTPYISLLAILSDNLNATLFTYNLTTAATGTIQHNLVITGDLEIEGNIYTITTDDSQYEITVVDGAITEISV